MIKSMFFIPILSFMWVSCVVSPEETTNKNDLESTRLTDTESDKQVALQSSDGGTEPGDSADDILDTATSCDGVNVDCYGECQPCAEPLYCSKESSDCNSHAGCSAYRTCLETECCPPNDSEACLTGTEYETCASSCLSLVDEFDPNIAINLYDILQTCLMCPCWDSCVGPEVLPWESCIGLNTLETPCYPDQAEDSETSCFAWAGWGGPCSEKTNACKNDTDCIAFEQCINSIWVGPDDDPREMCEQEMGSDGAQLFWAYQQCIHCDACSEACAVHSGYWWRCDEYTNY